MILNGINFGCTFLGLYIVEHYGRRKSLMAGSAWMFVCFLVFASVGHFALNRDFPDQTPSASIAMICFACFFIFGYAISKSKLLRKSIRMLTGIAWGPIVWTIIAELFPSRYRAKGMALSTASNW